MVHGDAVVEDAYPVASLQLGMLYEMLREPDVLPYHQVAGLPLGDALPFAAGALEAAAAELVARHEILRTSFDLGAAHEPRQVVHRRVALPLDVTDLTGMPAGERERALRAAVAAEALRPLDPATAPLLRLRAFRLTETAAHLLIPHAHAVLDGWSLMIVLSELVRDYRLARRGDPPDGERPPVRYRRFIELERAALRSPAVRGFWHDWLDRLAPGSLPAPSADASAGPARRRRVPFADLAPSLRKLAADARVPLKTVLLAAHLRAVGALSGSRDVFTGLVCDGRPEEPGADRACGLFLNTVPFGVTGRHRTWRELVRAVLAAEIALLPRRRYPLAALQVERGGRDPLVRTLFTFVDLRAAPVRFELHLPQTRFPLDVSASADAFDLELDPAAFGPRQREMVVRLYRDVVAAMAADPEGDPGAVSLTEAERVRVLVGFNPPPREAVAGVPFRAIWDRIAERARSRPEAAAIVAGEERLSRMELDRRAGALAARLSEAGAGPEIRIGVLHGRTAGLACALLGVLRSGATYVPLDPAEPDVRLQSMVRQADLRLVVTSAATRHRLPPGTRGVVLEEIAAAGPEPGSAVGPEQLAYAIFTSGSTGAPKGVVIAHGALATHLASIIERYELGEHDRVLQFAPAGFDVSLEQLLAPLAAGGAVVMRGEDPPAPAALLDLMDAERVTVAELTPQYWYEVLDEVERRRAVPRSLRLMLLGGDAAAGAQLERWRRLAPGVRTMNTYGPTEAAITATTWELDAGPVAAVAPLGRPLPHVRAYVLDPDLRPVAAGVAGELCLAGAGLARGYLGRPDLTAAAFVADPYGAEPGGRLYRTGDRARWDADGTLQFLGRMDDQVKVRGFRVEPGEAAAALRAHPAVAEALVLGRPDPSSNGIRLVAYVTPAAGAAPDPSELRSFLRGRLPPHLLPAALVPLAALPLTRTGKVDRAALPDPADGPDDASGSRREPVTATERWLADTLTEVLGCARPGVDDDFFVLGGHSLSLLRLAARVRERFGIELAFRTVFEHSSIGSLAPLLDGPTGD